MTRVCGTECTPVPSGTARRKTSNTDSCSADGTGRGWLKRIHTWKSGGGGGGGGGVSA